MPLSRKGRKVRPERPRRPVPFVSSFSSSSIELIVEVKLVDMQFLRVDPDDRAVLFMEASDMEGVLPTKNDIVVKLVPKGELACVPLTWSSSPSHQKVAAASRGPGNLRIGLKKSR